MSTAQQTFAGTDFQFPHQSFSFRGKVRDNYIVDEQGKKFLISVTTDRLSVFNQNIGTIPGKGNVNNMISSQNMENTKDIIPNWQLLVPFYNVTIGKPLDMIPLEVIVRGYLIGGAYEKYQTALKEWNSIPHADTYLPSDDFAFQIGGNWLDQHASKNYKLPIPVVEFTRKSDTDPSILESQILEEKIVDEKIVDEETLEEIKRIAIALFNRIGDNYEKKQVLLADTKFEFGFDEEGVLTLADEVCTPDSSRLFFMDPKNPESDPFDQPLSKQIARELILANNGVKTSKEFDAVDEPKKRLSELQTNLLESKYKKLSILLRPENLVPITIELAEDDANPSSFEDLMFQFINVGLNILSGKKVDLPFHVPDTKKANA
jgi:phosphoribosylaminoimidazole-succinocarboxamide synthase